MAKKGAIVSARPVISEEEMVGMMKTQIGAIKAADLSANFERIRFGAMVNEAVQILKLDNGVSARRGPTAKGNGASTWYNRNFAESEGKPAFSYQTVMRWMCAARNIAQLQAGNMGPDNLMKLLAAPDTAIDSVLDAEALESAEKIANGHTMKQLLMPWMEEDEKKSPGRKAAMSAEEYQTKRRDRGELATMRFNRIARETGKWRTLCEDAEYLDWNYAEALMKSLEPIMAALKERVSRKA